MKQTKFKKIMYVPSLNLGVIWWRIENYANALVRSQKDWVVHVNYLVDPEKDVAWEKLVNLENEIGELIRQKLEATFQMFDFIIFQKIQYKEALDQIEILRKKYPKVKIIAEVDDSIGDVSISTPYKFKHHLRDAAYHCIMSDAIITTTPYLADSIRSIVGKDKPIHIAPNCIDHGNWEIKNRPKKSKDLRIGYVGGGGHDEDLELAFRGLLPIIENDKNLKLIIRYGGFRPDYLRYHEQIDFKQVNWHPSVYAQKLTDMNLDLALVPLRDSSFNRCKSAIKWLEWASIDVPVIASKLEAYKGLKDIFYVDQYDKWNIELKKTIEIIKKNKKNKKKAFKNLYLKAREIFNIEKEAKKLLDFLVKI